MLNTISKLLTGEMLKVLSDMGHGDVLILGDANFPGEALAKNTAYGKLIRCPGVDAATLYEAFAPLFPLDVDYSAAPIAVMDLTESDKQKGATAPEVWEKFRATLKERYPEADLSLIERFDFYEKTRHAYAIIETGEERKYGNLLLVKGCVM